MERLVPQQLPRDEQFTIPGVTLTLRINYDITFVELDNRACHTRLSLMLEATCLLECPIPFTSMSEVTKVVVCPTFLNHLPSDSLSSSGHSCNCHVNEFESLI